MASRRAAVFALEADISMRLRSQRMSDQFSRRISADRIPENAPMATSGRMRCPASSRMRRISSGVKISMALSGTRNASLSSAAVFRSG